MLGVFRVETARRQKWLMHFQVKMAENGRKNIFRDMQTINKVLVMFLEVKVVTER